MDFYKRASIVCQNIPYGTVVTYGQIALLCQKPKNSRQVGYALRTGKLGPNIPAHRILNASGILSGATSFDKGWKTDLKKYQWKTTLDDALYFESVFNQNNI